MFYIRFLKTPRLVSEKKSKTLKAVVTVTTDLGESFYAGDISLAATVRSGDPDGDIYLRKTYKWTEDMRALPITFNVTDVIEPDDEEGIRLHVGTKGNPFSDAFEAHHAADTPPSLISAWSAVMDPREGIANADTLVERRFTPLSNRTLSVWEETGESIARHIWDAGLALSGYLDRIVALQQPDVMLALEQVLASATYRKLHVLELGAGCGIVGISLAQLIPDCEVTLTDLPEAENIVRKNIAGMKPAMASSVRFECLDWEKPLPASIKDKAFDMVIISDCTYNADSTPHLVNTISEIVMKSPKTLVIIAMKVRHPSEAVFFDLIGKAGLVSTKSTSVPLPTLQPKWGPAPSEKVDIYIYHHRQRVLSSSFTPNAASPISFWDS